MEKEINMHTKLILGIVYFIVTTTFISAQTLPEKWGKEVRKTIIYIDVPITDNETGGVKHIIGTGFIISKEGHLLTANHIFKEWNAQSASEKNKNKIYGRIGGNTSTEVFPLETIGDADIVGDVVLMKLLSPPKVFSRLPLCFNTNISEGEGVVAYGFPMGNDLQPTHGTIGNKNGTGGRYSANSDFTYGMSGGPVFNQTGVIGIVKGGLENEPAVRWITPIRFSRNLVNKAPDFLECTVSQESTIAEKQLRRELIFRVKQIDEALVNAENKSIACYKELEQKGTVKGACVRDFFTEAQKITVAFELGGIYRIPGKGEDTVWISSSGYGIRHLPERQSYKNKQYANSTVGEILEDYWSARGERKKVSNYELDKYLQQLKGSAQFNKIDILKDWFQRHQASGKYKQKYGGAYKVYDFEMDDYQNEINIVDFWRKSIKEEWEQFKRRNIISIIG